MGEDVGKRECMGGCKSGVGRGSVCPTLSPLAYTNTLRLPVNTPFTHYAPSRPVSLSAHQSYPLLRSFLTLTLSLTTRPHHQQL